MPDYKSAKQPANKSGQPAKQPTLSPPATEYLPSHLTAKPANSQPNSQPSQSSRPALPVQSAPNTDVTVHKYMVQTSRTSPARGPFPTGIKGCLPGRPPHQFFPAINTAPSGPSSFLFFLMSNAMPVCCTPCTN